MDLVDNLNAPSSTMFQMPSNFESDFATDHQCAQTGATSLDAVNYAGPWIFEVESAGSYPATGLPDGVEQFVTGKRSARNGLEFHSQASSTAVTNKADWTTTSRQGFATSEDWAKNRQLIACLSKRMTLPKLIRHMEAEHGFFAT